MLLKTIKYFLILLLVIITAFVASVLWPRNIAALNNTDASLPEVSKNVTPTKVHYIKSGEVTTLDAFTYSGGHLLKPKTLSHGAILIEHPKGVILVDSGLGKNAQAQFEQDMPDYLKPMMAFEQITDTKSEIINRNLPLPNKILLTHAHWDHASALEDFGNIEVMLNKKELDYVLNHGIPDIFPSQVVDKEFTWNAFELENKQYGMFEQSLDLFNDGSIVIVPLKGHSPGSIGIFINNKDSRRFLVGDAVWNAKAIEKIKPKMWVSSFLTDGDQDKVKNVIAQLHELKKQNPELLIVPAHDEAAWK